MKFINVFIFCTICSFFYSQSKKEQIETLSNRVDSLIEVLNFEKKSNKNLNETLILKLDSLKELITNEKQSNLNNSTAISELNSNNKSINSELSKLKQELALIKLKNDSLNLMSPEKKQDIKKEYTPFTIWNITIGKSVFDEIAEYLKSKKNKGYFTDLSIGTIDNAKSIFNGCRYIRSYTATPPFMSNNLDGILSNKCHDLTYYFDGKDICIGIKIQFWQKKDYPSNIFDKQVSDMEKLFSEKAIVTTETDVIGDKKKIAKIVKENINVKIIEDVTNNEHDLGPTIFISSGR
jgi:hypothetical protein